MPEREEYPKESRAEGDSVACNNYCYPAASDDAAAGVLALFDLLAAIAMTVFTAGLVGTSIYQWKAVRNQARTSKRALQIEHRPWIVPTERSTSSICDPHAVFLSDTIEMRIGLVNAGKTPARRLTIKLEYNISEWLHGMPENPQYEGAINYSIGALGPGIAHEQRVFVPTSGIGSDKIAHVRAGALRFTVCGFVQYGGHVARSQHTTKFCLLWDSDTKRFVISGPYNDCT